MQILLFASLFAGAAAQFPFPPLPPIPGGLPPIPGGGGNTIPGIDCLNVLSQVCPDDNTDLCLQCTSSLAFVLARAGCTDKQYNEYCQSGMKCEDLLAQFGCNKAATPDACYGCAQTNQNALLGAGCDQYIIESECERLSPDPSQCEPALKRVCGDLAGQGEFCQACVEENIQTLVPAGCTYNSTTLFCTGNEPDLNCEMVLDNECGEFFMSGTDCFHCLAANQDAIRKAKCANDQLSGFCAPRPGPEPPAPVPAGCTGLMKEQCPDKSNQVTCLRCVSSDFEALMRVGCTKEEVIGYCNA